MASAFTILELARVAPQPAEPAVFGRATLAIPERTVTSFSGAYNEIAWAIVVEAELAADPRCVSRFPSRWCRGRTRDGRAGQARVRAVAATGARRD